MAKFRIGQRIKKVRGEANIGTTGVVAGFKDNPKYPDHVMLVKVDQPISTLPLEHGGTRPAGSLVLFEPDYWEPIVPDGSKPSEFKSIKDLLDSLNKERVS